MNENQPIFDTTGYQRGVAWHNVGGVLRAAKESVSKSVAEHYGTRAGHIPDAGQIGILVANPRDPEISDQMAYQSRLMGNRQISINPLSSNDRPREKTLVVPYINTPEAEKKLKSLDMDIWGLPSVMVDLLKNKAECHKLISSAGIENFELPEHNICLVDELSEAGSKLLADTETMYAQAGLLSKYPLGLMIRTAESDGNYGSVILVQKPDGVHILPDGKLDQMQIAPDWKTALEIANRLLSATLNLEVENRLIVSRFMDLADSPGESVIFLNGQSYSLGWNGQVKEPGSSACVGTSSYQPVSDQSRRIHEEAEAIHTQAFINFIKYVAHYAGIDFNLINGVANADWMIPGPREVELQRRLGKMPKITVAETNPRLTNWTDALLLAMWAKGLNQTIAGMMTAIAEQILAVDKFPVPIQPETPMSTVRHEISELDYRLHKQSGSRVILRMPDKPNMGVIFTGDINNARNQTEKLIRLL